MSNKGRGSSLGGTIQRSRGRHPKWSIALHTEMQYCPAFLCSGQCSAYKQHGSVFSSTITFQLPVHTTSSYYTDEICPWWGKACFRLCGWCAIVPCVGLGLAVCAPGWLFNPCAGVPWFCPIQKYLSSIQIMDLKDPVSSWCGILMWDLDTIITVVIWTRMMFQPNSGVTWSISKSKYVTQICNPESVPTDAGKSWGGHFSVMVEVEVVSSVSIINYQALPKWPW